MGHRVRGFNIWLGCGVNAMSRIQPLKPFGVDADANDAVERALRPGYLYAKRRARFIATKFRNGDARAAERAFIESLEGDLLCLCPAHVASQAFRDAVQTVLQREHGRSISLAPLPRMSGAVKVEGRDHDLLCAEAEEQIAARQRTVNTLRKKLEKAQADLRKAQADAADRHLARDRFRVANEVPA